MAFIPHTPADVAAMLEAIGAGAIEDLFDEIPPGLRVRSLAAVPPEARSPEPSASKHPTGEQGTASTASTPPITSKTVEPVGAPARTADQTHPAASPARAAGEPTITSAGTFFSGKLLWAAVVGLIGLAAGLAWFRRSRGRVAEPVSLITHSLEQNK